MGKEISKVFLFLALILAPALSYASDVTVTNEAAPIASEEAPAIDAWSLGHGSRGSEVHQLQQSLAQMGFLASPADGVFGNQTEQAVRKAQRNLGMDENGLCDRRLVEGLRRMNDTPPSRSGSSVRARQVLTMEATAYTRHDAGVGGITAGGNPMRRGLVATDPRIIPMGTRLYIEGYGYAIADDTGGAIRGHKIDLAVDTLAEAYQIGRRQMTVYILE